MESNILYSFSFTEEAEKHLKWFHEKNIKNIKNIKNRIDRLLANMSKTPRDGIGKPEKLKHYDDEFYSRRINKYHRIVYKIDDKNNEIIIISMYGHYDKK